MLPDGVGAITTIHLVLMALVAIAAIAIIIVGMRRAAARRHAERKVESNARDAGVPTIEEAARPASEPAAIAPPPPPPAPVPVAPAPAPVPAMPAPVTPPPVERTAPEPTPPEPAPLADEPIAAAAPFDASPATVAATDPAPVGLTPIEMPARPEPVAPEPVRPEPVQAPATDPADTPVTMLKGLGPKLEARLAALGITTVGQLASLSPAEAASLDAQLGPFTGRMARDRWLEQARLLASGDRAGFEAAFGRL
ncbi:hypothetical protein IFT82_05170 [Sphingomonas sp. CFBP 8760]|nr:hypothetical protein [Sphingomonas sp. CFBP 8760]